MAGQEEPGRDWSVAPFCPSGALTESRVSCRVARRFGRRRHADPAVEAAVEATWAARVAANPRLFNGTKLRLHAFALEPPAGGGEGGDSEAAAPPRLLLSLGLTDYRAFLGTNAAAPEQQRRLRADGAAQHAGDGAAYLSQKLGVGGVTTTADGFVVFIVRSAYVAEAQGMVDVPGGHPEPSKVPGLAAAVAGEEGEGEEGEGEEEEAAAARGGGDAAGPCGEASAAQCEGAVRELFRSVADEVTDEVNIPPPSLTAPLLLGLVSQLPTAGTPSAAFALRCSLTRAEVEARYALGAREAFESTELLFVRGEDLLAPARAAAAAAAAAASADVAAREATVAAGEALIAPLRFTPATRGCLALWTEHHLQGGLK